MTPVPHPFRDFGERGGKAPTPTGYGHQNKYRWRPRDFLAAAILFLATATFVLWQNSRVAVLWDLEYLLDSSYRIALGQMPYHDFPFVHPPGTFLLQAALIRLAGRHYFLVIGYAALAGGLGTVVAWRILLRILGRAGQSADQVWGIAILLAAPLIFLGVYSIYPHPIYDCDCALSILMALLLLLLIDPSPRYKSSSQWSLPLAAGGATVLPIFFKQNMGLPFVAVVAAGLVSLLAVEAVKTRSSRLVIRSPCALAVAGMAIALTAALGLIAATAGLGNYLHWTVSFAAQRRMPGLASMVGVYRDPSLLWTLPLLGAGLILCISPVIRRPWARIVAFCLIAAPFVAALVLLGFNEDADERGDTLLSLWPLWLLVAFVAAILEVRRGLTLHRLMPFFVLAAIHGTFLSQQLWGSTYAIWPLLLMLVAYVLSVLPIAARPVGAALAATLSITLLVCGGLYSTSLERLSYIRIPDAPIEHSTIPALRGMADRGDFLRNLDELVAFTAREIPASDALLLFPGEDPFYYATGRTPQFPVLLFDITTDPFSPAELFAEARRRNVRWVIVKRATQINTDPMPQSEQTLGMVAQQFMLYRRLNGYDIYRRPWR